MTTKAQFFKYIMDICRIIKIDDFQVETFAILSSLDEILDPNLGFSHLNRYNDLFFSRRWEKMNMPQSITFGYPAVIILERQIKSHGVFDRDRTQAEEKTMFEISVVYPDKHIGADNIKEDVKMLHPYHIFQLANDIQKHLAEGMAEGTWASVNGSTEKIYPISFLQKKKFDGDIAMFTVNEAETRKYQRSVVQSGKEIFSGFIDWHGGFLCGVKRIYDFTEKCMSVELQFNDECMNIIE